MKKKKSPTHYQINFCGIRLSILKPHIRRMRKNFAKYKNPADVPCATGNLRLVQLTSFAILKRFDRFARQNGLGYWLDFGSLLGAVRHKGFIPWDDDMDIGMMRDDYDKLYEICKSELPEDLVLTEAFGYRECCFLRLKHKDISSIFVDIFPYDYFYKPLTDEEKQTESQNITDTLKKYSHEIHSFDNFEAISDCACKIRDREVLLNKPVDKSSHPAIFMGIDFPHSWKNKFYNWDDIFPLGQIKFENEIFYCPNKPEKVLTSIFGDYMSMPKDLAPKHIDFEGLPAKEKRAVEKFVKGN